MNYGLSSEEFNFLQEKLIQPLKKYHARVFLFGSRATGKYKKFSDIDLIYTPTPEQQIPNSFIYKLLAEIEESTFPYKVDLVKNSALAQSYRSKVKKEKVEL